MMSRRAASSGGCGRAEQAGTNVSSGSTTKTEVVVTPRSGSGNGEQHIFCADRSTRRSARRLQRGVTGGFPVASAALAALAVIMLTVAAIAVGPGWAGQSGAVS